MIHLWQKEINVRLTLKGIRVLKFFFTPKLIHETKMDI